LWVGFAREDIRKRTDLFDACGGGGRLRALDEGGANWGGTGFGVGKKTDLFGDSAGVGKKTDLFGDSA
jgi:hypothetical protein